MLEDRRSNVHCFLWCSISGLVMNRASYIHLSALELVVLEGFGDLPDVDGDGGSKPAGFMLIFEAKGIEAHGEETHNNECQSFRFVRLNLNI